MQLDPAAETFLSRLKEAQAPFAETPSDEEISEDYLPGRVSVDGPDIESVIKAPEEKTRPVTIQNFLWNHDTHPLILYQALDDRYGPIWLEWDPDAIWIILERDYESRLDAITKDKINAVKTLLVVDSFWQDWEVFEKVIQAVNNNTVLFNIMQPPTLGQLVNGVQIAQSLRKSMKFDEEVSRYIASQAQEMGLEYLSEPLMFAQKFLGPIPKDVVARFMELTTSAAQTSDLKETAPDIQALQLMVAQSYAEHRQEQFTLQLQTMQP